MTNKRDITIKPHSVSALLTEVTRAALHGGCPSAVLQRVVAGMGAFTDECTSPRDRAFVDHCRIDLDRLATQWRAEELAEYGGEH